MLTELASHILLVANWESDVGYAWWLMENFWATIAQYYRAQNRRCTLIYPRVRALPPVIANSPIEVVELDFSERSPDSRRRLRRLIRERHIGAAYLTDRPYLSTDYLELRRAGVRRIVVHDHSLKAEHPPALPKRVLKGLLMRLPLVTADHYIGATSYICDRLIQVGRIPPDKCSCVANGIRPHGWSAATRARYRQWLGVDEATTVVVSTGRADRLKGIDFIIRAAGELIHRRQLGKLLFVHCGDGPELAAFQGQVRELGLDRQFRFLGRRQDVRDLLSGCDVAIHASRGEIGYSLSILEYMDAGLVTFVPDRESVCGAITHGEDGLVYRHDSIEDLADQLQRVLADRALFERISANARSTIRREYLLERTNAQLLSTLERCSFGG